MMVIFAKPNQKRKKKPLKYSFTSTSGNIPATVDEIIDMREKIRKHDNDLPLSYLLTVDLESKNGENSCW